MPPTCMQQRISLRLAASTLWDWTVVWASARSAPAKSPSAEAASAAPPSFMSSAREMVLLSRPTARASKERAIPSCVSGDKAAPPFPALPVGASCAHCSESSEQGATSEECVARKFDALPSIKC